jgi:hypothetical protein
VTRNSWKDTAELVGIAAIVASLIFVGVQLKQDAAVASRESSSDYVSASIELAQLLDDNREIWIKGLSEIPLTESEKFTFDSLVRIFFLARVNQFRRQQLGISSYFGSAELQPKYVAFYLYQYPGLRKAWDRQMSRIDMMNVAVDANRASEFRSLVAKKLEEFDANPPELPVNDYIIF